MAEQLVMICQSKPSPLKASQVGGQSGTKYGEGCILSLAHPKSGNSTSFLLKDGVLQEFHWYKQSYGSWFLGDCVREDSSLYMTTPVDPIFIFLPIFSNARMKGNEPGVFRQLDEILYNTNYPSYQYLMSIAEESMQIVCEVKEIGSSKFFRLEDSKVLSWLCCKVQHLKAALIKLDTNYSAQEEKETLKEAVSILSEYLKDEPWLKLLCIRLKLDMNEAPKQTPGLEDDLLLSQRSPEQGKGSSGKAKTGIVKPAKKTKVETDSRNIKDMFYKASRRVI
ncbi:hypothetical protein HPP92_024271 [Vanilla planifolia]|uniref:Ribonuclease H2 subunit B n=1 Tax=Vanilla planifolia TaxID=51239 RepID=A0A835PNM4_VANPL|nr:hypothetical protein HPP92_024271 [Vanilla planifolia]